MKSLLPTALCAAAAFASCPATEALATKANPPKPNIVFLVGDDLGCDLGCYGNPYVLTPNIDGLAREGASFTKAFATAPVCAPSRAAMFTGIPAIRFGAQHMRSTVANPPKTLPEILRDAAYTVAWPNKTDFNFANPEGLRDTKKHWLGSELPKEPFFAYLNLGEPHEGSLKTKKVQNDFLADLPADKRVQPEKIDLAPYYPRDSEIQADFAMHYDLLSAMDQRIGKILDQLQAAGVADRTIVVLVGDHGRPFPRAKRWLYDSGLHVPLIVRWPGVIAPDTKDDSLVSLTDLAPTLLAAADLPVTKEMEGRILFGPKSQPAPEFVFSARDRMDDVEDRARSVRSERFRYTINERPEIPFTAPSSYADQSRTMIAMRRLHAEDALTGPAAAWFAPKKPGEEFYDLVSDPHEINNLAQDPAHAEEIKRHRAALAEWRLVDWGKAPEADLEASGLLLPRTPKK